MPRPVCPVFVAIAFLLLLPATSHADDVFRAGAATADLTPANGVTLDGPISKPGPAKGVHDRLHARALVLSLGDTTIALVVSDMCMIDRDVHDRAKQIVFQQIGLPPEQIVSTATHTHAAPRVARIGRAEADEAYRGIVAQQIARAIFDAHANLAPATLGYARFDKGDVLACRRYLCEPDSVGPNPFGETDERIKSVAGQSTAVIGPAGPVDPEFSILSLRHADGAPLALLGNFSVHYAGGYEGGLVSADYFGAYARRIEDALSGDASHPPVVGIMSNGTSGNTGSFTLNLGKKEPWALIDESARVLADETLAQLEGLEYEAPTELDFAFAELELGVRKPDAERLAWARHVLDHPDAPRPHNWTRTYAQEALHLAEYPDRYSIPLQALRIGDVAIATAPCEVFAETGLAIKEGSPLEKTFTMELANGFSGYLPTPEQHELGGYETWPARSSHLEVEAETKIRSELIRLLKEVAAE